MDWIAAFGQAAAKRPEIVGIIALAALMAWLVRQKKQRNGGQTFKLVIHAQLAGIYLLGAVLILREVGRILNIWSGP